MKKTKALVSRLLEELEKTPLVQVACDKIGISRNTFYRWMKEDQEFLERAQESISLGTGRVNDVAISNVLSGIQARDSKYTMYWLDRKHPDFRKPYVHKVDAYDLLERKRLLEEMSQHLRLQSNAKEESVKQSDEEIKRVEEEIQAWEQRWEAGRLLSIKKEAEKLFEAWIKDRKKKS